MQRPAYGWAALRPPWYNAPKAGREIDPASVRQFRREVIEQIGYRYSLENRRKGWREAYRLGWRIIRVRIQPYATPAQSEEA